MGNSMIHPHLTLLDRGPSSTIVSQGYNINRYTSYMRDQDRKSTNQNSGAV
jgi:hypothetical protein